MNPIRQELSEKERELRDSKTSEMMVHTSAAITMTPRRMSRALLPEKQKGTWFAEPIRASGRNRANRPDTRLLLTSVRIISNMSCYAGAIHTGHSPQQHNLMSDELTDLGQTGLAQLRLLLTQHFLACAAADFCSAADFPEPAIQRVETRRRQTLLSLHDISTVR